MDDIVAEVVIVMVILAFIAIVTYILFSTGNMGKIGGVFVKGQDVLGQIWHGIQNTINDSRMAT